MHSQFPMERCWVNQPSTLQRWHKYHGLNVLAGPGRDDETRVVYFLSGDVWAQEMDSLALSAGWRKSARDGLLAPDNVASPAPADPAGEDELDRLLLKLTNISPVNRTQSEMMDELSMYEVKMFAAIRAEVQRREAAAREEAKAAIREDAESLAVQAFARHVTLHDPEAAKHMERIDEETFVLAMEAALRAVAPEGPLTRSQP